MKIILVGGGTAGSVSPLLAVREYIVKQHPDIQFVFVGSKYGVERNMARLAKIPYYAIPGAKWRRYFSWKNLVTPFVVILGFIQSVSVLRKLRPACVFGAGSFLQVPVVWAAWCLRIPVVIHQQDVLPTLSNTLCSPFAKKITVTFESSMKHFFQGATLGSLERASKVVWTGNPTQVHKRVVTREQAIRHFNLDSTLPTLLVLGGGTGAQFINETVWEVLPDLVRFVNVIHSTGPGKNTQITVPRYYATEFISDMPEAYGAADIVLSRAGLATITELSALGKLAIIIPLPNSHQLANASLLDNHLAALVFPQEEVTGPGLIHVIRKLLFKKNMQDELPKNLAKIMPHDATGKISDILLEVCKRNA